MNAGSWTICKHSKQKKAKRYITYAVYVFGTTES